VFSVIFEGCVQPNAIGFEATHRQDIYTHCARGALCAKAHKGDLLNAVKERLRLTVELHMTLPHELGRRQHLERGVFDAKNGLASVNGQEF